MATKWEVLHPNAAGIDIGAKFFYVSAQDDVVKVFNTFTEGCNEVKDYLHSQGITTVAMESTGVYWIVLYDILEKSGVEVFLINGRDAKNVPGRKSDIRDCQWLRQLHTYGLLRKSFIPKDEIRQLRSYMRLRQDHIRAQSQQVNLMQKALTQMNIRLREVISDIMGASGNRILQAILSGERDAETLVQFCHESILNTKRDMVIKSLNGNYRQEHLFALKQCYQTYAYYQEMIDDCDKQIEIILNESTKNKDDFQSEIKIKKIRAHKPKIQDIHPTLLKMTDGKDPVGIAGITDYSFLQLVSEIGSDLCAWKTEKHFVSWLKLAPLKSQSGKVNKRLNVKRANNASLLFRTIAQGILTSKHLALGVFGRRIRAKRGSGIAIKAIARKIACYYYRVMTKGKNFVDIGIARYEKLQQEQKLRYLERLAYSMNLKVVSISN